MTYKLELPRLYLVLVFGVLLLLTVVGLAMLAMTLLGSTNVPPLFILVVWCAILAWNWYVVLGLPYRIEYEGPSDIRFVSLRGTARLAASSIESLKCAAGGMYVPRHENGTIRLLPNFTGCYTLLTEIKAANPRFETRGI